MLSNDSLILKINAMDEPTDNGSNSGALKPGKNIVPCPASGRQSIMVCTDHNKKQPSIVDCLPGGGMKFN